MVLERIDRNINLTIKLSILYTIIVVFIPLLIGSESISVVFRIFILFVVLVIALETCEQAVLTSFEGFDIFKILFLFFKEFMISLILTSFSVLIVSQISLYLFGIDVITRKGFIIGLLLIFSLSSAFYAFYTYKIKIPEKLDRIGNNILRKISSNYSTNKIEKAPEIKVRLSKELEKLVELSTIILTVILLGISTFSVIGYENTTLKTEDLFPNLEYNSLFLGLALYAQWSYYKIPLLHKRI